MFSHHPNFIFIKFILTLLIDTQTIVPRIGNYLQNSRLDKNSINMCDTPAIPTFKLVLVGDGGTGKV